MMILSHSLRDQQYANLKHEILTLWSDICIMMN